MARHRGKVPRSKWRYAGSKWNRTGPSDAGLRETLQESPMCGCAVISEDPLAIASLYNDLIKHGEREVDPTKIEYVESGRRLNIGDVSVVLIKGLSKKYNCKIEGLGYC